MPFEPELSCKKVIEGNLHSLVLRLKVTVITLNSYFKVTPPLLVKKDVDLRGAETMVLSLVSQREAALRAFKVQIGSMASNFLENPNERIYVLERLVAAVDSVDPLVATSGFRDAI